VLLIGGLALLVYAFSVRFLALANQPLRAGLKQQPRAFDEAARLLGASPWRTFRSVNLPLLRPSLIAAALLVLMGCLARYNAGRGVEYQLVVLWKLVVQVQAH